MNDNLDIASNCNNTHIRDILQKLSNTQRAFLVAKSDHRTDTEACNEARISVSTMRHWPKTIRDLIHQAESLMAQDTVSAALQLRRQVLVRAMIIKAEGLDSQDERIRQTVASEIIQAELGKPGVKKEQEQNDEYLSVMTRVVLAMEKAVTARKAATVE
jgi:hypothetical protein